MSSVSSRTFAEDLPRTTSRSSSTSSEATLQTVSSRRKPTLYIEVECERLLDSGIIRTDSICDEVGAWLRANYPYLTLNVGIEANTSLKHAHVVRRIVVADYSESDRGDGIYRLSDVDLEVQAYELHEALTSSESEGYVMAENEEVVDEPPGIRTTNLPHQSLQETWNSLVFDEPIPAKLLRYITRMSILERDEHMRAAMGWNRTILLYGPPGCGKTTLCKALAQKLTIRLCRHYTSAKLVEIYCGELFSKWFGESSKLVGKVFSKIHEVAEDSDTLVCVLIDEVESIATSRARSTDINECSDSVRVTNRLLTALDRLRESSNVLLLCTSNLLRGIDAAFMDRIDYKQYIQEPRTRAKFEILRSGVNAFVQCGYITYASNNQGDSELPLTISGDSGEIPTLDQLLVNDEDLNADRIAAARGLEKIAAFCKGVSPRALRKLPQIAWSMYTDHVYTSCPVGDFLQALTKAAEDERFEKHRDSSS